MIAFNEKPDIYGNNKMFSKLVFLSNDGEIEFQSHEMVKIAEELLSTAAREFISIPNYQTEEDYLDDAFESFDSSIMRQYAAHYKQVPDTFKSELESFKAPKTFNFPTLKNYGSPPTNPLSSKEIFDEILLPASVKAIDTLGKWLFLADSFHKKYEDSELKGWWLTIDNRLILLRNLLKDKSHLYVSDHGFTEDVKKEIKSNLLQFDDVWQNLMPYFQEFSKFYTKLSPEEKGHVKNHFVVKIDENYGGDLISNCSLLYKLGLPKDMRNHALNGGEVGPNAIGAKIQESDPGIEPVEPEVLSNIEPTTREDYELIYKSTLETVLYIGKSYITFVQQAIQISPLLTQIERIFHQEDARYYNNFFTLTAMGKKHTKGLQEFLIRPLHSFGLRDKGESYRGFADAIQKCSNEFTDSELANKIRTILKGGTINDERLYFLANLVAAWFVSEPARYKRTILSNLILLDFLESNAKDHNGNVLYTFQNVLIHPNKPPETLTEVKINDLYGDTIDLAFFDGVHPMAHRDSVLHGRRTLGNGQKLSSTHQKEGHLLIHWLDQKISKDIKKYVVVARPQEDSTEEQRCCLLDANPLYNDIRTLLDAKQKPSQKIKNNPILNRKWEILYQIIIPLLRERLNSLDKLL